VARTRTQHVTMSFVVEKKQLQRLDAVAARQRRSRSFVVRDFIDRELARYEAAQEAAPR